MLPPIPEAILTSNPGFAVLHKHLTTNVLLPDGSTKLRCDEHKDVQKRLTSRREAVLKDTILLNSLEEIVNPLDTHTDLLRNSILNLPPEVRDAVFHVSTYLSVMLDPRTDLQALPSDTAELMAEQLDLFRQHLPEIAAILSQHLSKIELRSSDTAKGLFPSQSCSTTIVRNDQPSLLELVEEALHSTSELREGILPRALQSLQSASSVNLEQHTTTLHDHIRSLELHTHGAQSRYMTARSTYLAATAKSLALQTRIAKMEAERDVMAEEELMIRVQTEIERLEKEEHELDRQIEKISSGTQCIL